MVDSMIFTITNREDGLAALTYICEAIKAREDANHALYFSRRLMGMYCIFNSNNADETTREIIFCPVGSMYKIVKKNIVDCRNCMWFVGDTDIKKARLQGVIDWILDKGGVLKEDSDSYNPQLL